VALALALAASQTLAAQSVPPDRAADAAAIRRQIEAICQAFVDKDPAKLVATHGKDWRGFTPYSDHVIRGRDGYMNEATFDPAMPKGQGMVGYRLSDFDVVFYGETAVASFLLDLDTVSGTRRASQKLTLIDVFHKEAGGWIQVASNTSFHPDEIERRMSEAAELDPRSKAGLLSVREAVWRAWFAGDVGALAKLLPPELVTTGPGEFGTYA